ncbi:unnamed protein product [Anisakis simplex]|uniref:Uncharacterized protein n=1 Tax=Anisakis simplex TaxID=6269 RepID=A0A0M3KJE1_ANISI|nr:unnamed protein product [Anisakis simplex]
MMSVEPLASDTADRIRTDDPRSISCRSESLDSGRSVGDLLLIIIYLFWLLLYADSRSLSDSECFEMGLWIVSLIFFAYLLLA